MIAWRRAALWFAVAALAGCASAPVPLPGPVLVQGVVTQPQGVRWARNICRSWELVRYEDRWISDTCMPHGGEFASAILESPQDSGGKILARQLRIGFPSHGYLRSYRKNHYLILQQAPADFFADTGIAYVATIVERYDAAHVCLADGPHHLDYRTCSDRTFHERHAGQCIPQAEYLAHLAADR
jgi:hypothetical protein